MEKVIETYKKFIFIYIVINCFALFVNIFGIEGSVNSDHDPYNAMKINIFTSKWHTSYKNGFWPFISFVEDVDLFRSYGTHEYDYTKFNGIFYQYDISEFICYILILIGCLVYKVYIKK
jgi:hypothetical protein